MIPTRIQEIRQQIAEMQTLCDAVTGGIGDTAPTELLQLWDTRDAALRSLVQEWREEREANLKEGNAGNALALQRAYVLEECADQLDARLAEV